MTDQEIIDHLMTVSKTSSERQLSILIGGKQTSENIISTWKKS